MNTRTISLSSHPKLAAAKLEDEIMQQLKKAIREVTKDAGGRLIDFALEAGVVSVTFSSKEVGDKVAAYFSDKGIVLEQVSDVAVFFGMLNATESTI